MGLQRCAEEYLAFDSYELRIALQKNKANVYLYARTHDLGLHVMFTFMCPYGACTASALRTVPVNTSFLQNGFGFKTTHSETVLCLIFNDTVIAGQLGAGSEVCKFL